ncbi:MAG: hypothetical protein ACKO3S_02885 [bacterium]
MLPLPLYQVVSRLLPEQCSGRTLHRRALAAAAVGNHAEAERWFEVAATLYRGELAVEAMARLRVHQLMVRARAGGEPAPEALLEIVRRLNRLDRLESFDAPHELTDARSVLSAWLGEGRVPVSVDAGLTTSRAA